MLRKLMSVVSKNWKTFTVVVVLFALIWAVAQWLIIPGYLLPWTGFADYISPKGDYVRGKTLWDWMELFIIPIVLAMGAFLLNHSEREIERQRAEERAALEREIATDRQQESALQSYLDRMAILLLDENLHFPETDKVHNVARIRTLTVLRGLDGKRKGIVLLFLYEAGLIAKEPIINLNGADLTGAYLYNADLRGANLSGADLQGANLIVSKLIEADLHDADMKGVNLEGADLSKANLTDANLYGANLFTAELSRANLYCCNLSSANLGSARFVGASLQTAKFYSADLFHTDLSDADLTNAVMDGAILDKAHFNKANLKGVTVTNKQLATVMEIKGAIMPDGTKHD